MTPGGRLSAAIELLDLILTGEAAERALTRWARASRFAGSTDRAAVRDIVYDTLRQRRSALWTSGADTETGRALVTGLLAMRDVDQLAAFDGTGHAPAPLNPAEQACLGRPLEGAPAPIRCDYPDALAAEIEDSFGRADPPELEALRHRAPVDLRVNAIKADVAMALDALAEDEITAAPVDGVPGALRVTANPRRIAQSRAYRDGLVELQDAASQLTARAAGARPGMTVLDLCAGGGGKTLALAAEMRGEGRILAYDADPARMRNLPERAARAGVVIELADDALLAREAGTFDLIMIDAPCSGSGSWRRNPDLKWRMTAERLSELIGIQSTILDRAEKLVAPSGKMLYATCSIFRSENEAQSRAFRSRHEGAALIEETRLAPGAVGDGFYFCKISLD